MKTLYLKIIDHQSKINCFNLDCDIYSLIWPDNIVAIDENLLALRNFVLVNNYKKIIVNCKDNIFIDVNIYLKDLKLSIVKDQYEN